jgi:hypothetical protein
MSQANRIHAALELGCPALAAEWLLQDDGPAAYYRVLLRRGDASLAIPAQIAARETLASHGVTCRDAQPEVGVRVLSIVQIAGELVGRVEILRGHDGQPNRWDEFAAGCRDGIDAAICYLIDKFGAIEPRPMWFEPRLVDGRVDVTPRAGASAGLAAAVAAAARIIGREAPLLAATGIVGRDGVVVPVEGLRLKIPALQREDPSVRVLLVPAGQIDEATRVAPTLDIRGIAHVRDALDQLFGEPANGIDLLGPEQAAEAAVDAELEQRHTLALSLARRAVAAAAQPHLEEFERLCALGARTIIAANHTHSGRAGEALEEIRRAEGELASAPADAARFALPADARALRVAIKASALIDRLEPDEAHASCEAAAALLDVCATRSAHVLLGTWSRAAVAAGDLPEGETLARRQMTVPLRAREAAHVIRAIANLVVALIPRCEAEPDVVAEVEELLAEAEQRNDALPGSAARVENRRYQRLHRAHLAAVTGDAETGRRLASEAIGTDWPDLHVARYAGEACLRSGATRAGVDLLENVLSRMPDDPGPFMRLVLLTGPAVAARARLALGEDLSSGGKEFLSAFRVWRPSEPLSVPSAPAAISELLDALVRRIPY